LEVTAHVGDAGHCALFVYQFEVRVPSRSEDMAVFLPRDAMRKRGLCCRPVSVGLSVTSVHCIHTAEDIVKILIRPGSPVSLVF